MAPLASSMGAGVAATRAVIGAVTRQRISGLTSFILVMFAVTPIGAAALDDPRFILVKDSLPRALCELICLVTLARGRPSGARKLGQPLSHSR